MNRDAKIYIPGHTGMVGSALVRKLTAEGYTNLLLRTHSELDLLNQAAVNAFFEEEKPDYVFLAAAKVGGIVANNTYRAQFIYENLQIQNNIIHLSHVHGVKKLLFLGSSCIYPREAPQPIKEEYLLTGPLEPTNEPYAVAKIAGIKMCQAYRAQYGCNFISVMPTNLYGPNDNYDLETSHVLAALLRKFHLAACLERNDWQAIRADLNKRPVDGCDGRAEISDISRILAKYGVEGQKVEGSKVASLKVKSQNVDDLQTFRPSDLATPFSPASGFRSPVSVCLWGSGAPRREFLHVDDLADACLFLMNGYDSPDIINIGVGQDISIRELAQLMQEITGFRGEVRFDAAKPDGTPRKLLDVSRLRACGWQYAISLRKGVERTWKSYCGGEKGEM